MSVDDGAEDSHLRTSISDVPPDDPPVNARLAAQEWMAAFLFLFVDLATWVVIYGAMNAWRPDPSMATPFQYWFLCAINFAVIFGALYIVGGYDRHIEMRSLFYTAEHLLAFIAAAIVSSFLIYSAVAFSQATRPSRGVLLLSFALFAPTSLIFRRWIRTSIATTTAGKAFLVIGAGETAQQFYKSYLNSPSRQQLHFVDLEATRVGERIAGEGTPIIEGDLEAKLRDPEKRYSGIILAVKARRLSQQLLEKLVRTQFQRTRVYTLESFYESHWRYVPLEAIDPVWPLQMGFQLARISPYHYLKRLIDIVLSGVLLIVCWPIIIGITLLIWLTNGRPALYRQERVGREGMPFIAYKFRTMRNLEVRDQRSEVRDLEAEETQQEQDIYTREGDPRVTRLGRWLRKLRIDELPQLWNVFYGDMSMIGPRAEWIKCAERYENKIPFYHFRHLVKPGITGWAQVNYPYGESEGDAIEKLKYDLYYIRHYSLKLDAMIALKTVHTMLFARGR
jgi:exopolysaccharide biosynthesis polyprenyl glycosylphosphotransferase